MSRSFTLGVLSPFIGGWYFGGLLSGITRVAAGNGAAMIVVHTLEAGKEQTEITEPESIGNHIALDHVDGFVVIINAVPEEYLAAVRATGKPVVNVSHEYPGLGCQLVLPDNGTGVRQAVEHLIEHGHRRIAFAGYLGAEDIQLRHHAYRETLLAHGITPDEGLLFPASDNLVGGGVDAARAMIAAGLPSTAVIAATDANAIGILETLTAAGYSVPADQAIIGFDDVQDASYSQPRLSSVRQPVEKLGAAAAQLLLGQLRAGAAGPEERRYIDTELVVRESCGCAGGTADVVLPADLAGRLAVPMPPDDVRGLVAELAREKPEKLLGVAQQVREIARSVLAGLPADAPARQHAVANTGELILALMEAQGRAQYADAAYLQGRVGMQYGVSMALLRGYEDDPRQLGWLGRTHVWAGCLGLWQRRGKPAGADAMLDVVGAFCRDDGTAGEHHTPVAKLAGSTVPVTSFPPAELLDLAREHPERALFVAPVKVDDSDWGLLAVVDGVENRIGTGREPLNQWAALVTVALEHQAVLGALRSQEEQLRVAALYDHLTGLPNRALFLQRLGEAIRRGRRPGGSQFGVLFLDLDGFKLVNDSLGHAAGDRLLVQVAARISGQLRDTETAARFGGDEFLILVEDVDGPHALSRIADRLQTSLTRPFHLEGHDEVVVVGASIGITAGNDRYENPEDVLRDADIAMYSAKSQQKGSQAIFNVAMHTRAVDRLRMETELRAALERGEFELVYQPIADLRTGRPGSFEALLRWRHPTRGLLAPERFLAVADEADLIQPIGHWVLSEACRQLAAWQRDAGPDDRLHLAINLSDREFWAPDIIDHIEACLAIHELPAGSLAIEITEGVIMRDADQARKILRRLHDLGCELHIDDFGTGYSSLEALLQLPIDALKIDKSFVAGLGRDPRSEELVKTIVRMGHNLDLDLIAEGVETEEQRRLLLELGCYLGQGYLIAEPAPPEVAVAVMAQAA